ncbi:MAG: hypothetical protein RR623_09835 [Bacilli bacterium]
MNKLANYINEIKKNEKDKVILYNVIGAFAIKGVALSISIFSMPLYISYFNNEFVLGLWFTILSVLSWIFNFDLGLGNGLRNNLVELLILKDKNEIKKHISSSYFIISIAALITIIIGTIIFLFFNLNNMFNISESLISSKYLLMSIMILFVGTIISFILKLINSILYALQRSAINDLILLISNAIPIIFIIFFKSTNIEYKLIVLSIVYVISICMPLIIATIVVFKTKPLNQCFPRIKYFSKTIAKKVFTLGSTFFIVQIAFMLITATNEMIISNFFSPTYVVEYQIYNKLFTLIGSFILIGLTPIWSGVTKAFAQGDYNWIVKINKLLIMVAFRSNDIRVTLNTDFTVNNQCLATQ